jgi:hypothetical protein
MKTIVTISQPRYLPACSYIHRMLLSDIFVYLDNVKYSPRDWENRNKLKLSDGNAVWITVPVLHEHGDQLIRDTRINNESNWPRKHLNTLLYNYSKAGYFNNYIGFFLDVYSRKWDYLEELNIAIVEFFIKQLGLSCRFLKASELGVEGKGQELLTDICRRVGADVYLSGPMGSHYIHADHFGERNIKLVYHDYKCSEYPQMYGEFLPWMSFLDLLFNCGEESLSYLNRGNLSREDILKEL